MMKRAASAHSRRKARPVRNSRKISEDNKQQANKPMIVRNTVKSLQDIMRQDVGVDGDAQRISQLTWLFFLKIIDDQDQELEITKDGYRSPIPERLQWRNWAADPEGITGQALLDFVNDE